MFSSPRQQDQPSCICLRQDVDCIVWQPQSDLSTPWLHLSSFDAIGYVSASKQNRKFMSCTSDYVLIADCSRHLYLYRRSTTVPSELRNRKSGEKVNSVATQRLVTLEKSDTFLGVVCNNKFIAILTEHSLEVIHLVD